MRGKVTGVIVLCVVMMVVDLGVGYYEIAERSVMTISYGGFNTHFESSHCLDFLEMVSEIYPTFY